MKRTLVLLALVSTIAAASTASADQVVSPSKSVAAMSLTGLNLYSTGATASVALTGPRKGRLLVVRATAGQSGASQTLYGSATVNGVAMEPAQFRNTCPVGFCSASATMFLDLAQAEAAHPGLFYNTLTLDVQVHVYSAVSGGTTGKLSVVAELLKK